MDRVVLVVNALLRHGQGMFVYSLALGLVQRGQHVTIVSLGKPDEELRNALLSKGISVLEMPAVPGSILALRRILQKNEAGILHLHGTKSDLIGRLAGRLAGTAVVISTMHDTPDVYRLLIGPLRGALLTFAEIGTMTLADRVVMVSEATERAFATPLLAKVLGVKRRFHVIRNSVPDMGTIGSLDKTVGDELVVGTLASLTRLKGIDYLIEAALALRSHYLNVRFIVSGEGEYRSVLEQRIQAFGLVHSFLLPGVCRNVSDFMSQIDVFVLPSLGECLPLAILEAMSAGKAIIATPVGGVGEAIVTEQTGLLVPPADSQALALALDRLLSDAKLRASLGQMARQKYVQMFTVDRMVDQYIDLYRELLGKKPV